MKEFRKKLDTIGRFEPVVWDKSIMEVYGHYIVILREDGDTMEIKTTTFEKAKAIMDFFPPETF